MQMADNQHLEFLISQYVDDTLEADDRKLVETQIATNPVARQLYKDHSEAQDLLEEFGGRIPLINWHEFDQSLAARLADEAAVMKQKPQAQISQWRRWGRPSAIAASLLLAAGIGYGWRAFIQPVHPITPTANVAVDNHPIKNVQLTDQPALGSARQSVQVLEVPGESSTATASVKIQDAAGDSHNTAVANNTNADQNNTRKPITPVPGSVTAGVPEVPGEAPVENLR